MGGTTTLTQREQRLSDIRVQTASQGTVIPKGWGRYRVSCNLIWYGGFKAVEHRSVTEQGGKGGGGGVQQESITYTYEAAVIVALGHGPINGVVSAWKGKERKLGLPVTTRRKTLKHVVTVPVLSGASTYVVTVPSAASYAGEVSVMRVSDRSTDGARRIWSQLQRVTQYTHSGGVYTFNSKTPSGTYEINYQIEVAESSVSALGQLDLSLAYGTSDQAVWPWLAANHADQALAYPRLAYCYSPAYQLTNTAQIYNHNFEVSTDSELGTVSGVVDPVVDADPAVVVADVLLDESWGVGWDASRVAGLSAYSDYCVANGIWLSPLMTQQSSAADWLGELLKLTNTNVVWDGEVLQFVPLGDESVSAHGRTYTAATTPLVDLTADHFFPEEGSPPIRVMRHRGQAGSSEIVKGDDVGYNIVVLEIENRENGYATEPVSYEDTAHIAVHGRRQKETIKAPAVKQPDLGARIAALLCQAELAQRNVYEFTLAWTMGWLLPMNLVTITDAALDLDRKPVRILTIDEDGKYFKVSAMEADIGISSAPVYGTQAGSGYVLDHNVDPGAVAAPVVFEPPVELASETGLALWIAVTGNSEWWGGAEVWASLDDGVTYKRMGEARGGARYGSAMATLVSGTSGSIDIALAGRGGQMLGTTAQDAAALNSLVYVRDGVGGEPEYLAYTDATLTASNRYTLSGLVRGAYSTFTGAKTTGSMVVRVDDQIVKSEPLALSMIGKTVRLKFLSYNVFGGAMQAMDDATEYLYTITGKMVKLPPKNVISFTVSTQADGTRQFTWGWGSSTKPADLRGYVIRYLQGAGPYTWDQMQPFVTDDGFHTSSPVESNLLLAGPYVFAIKTIDTYGILAEEALYISATLPDPRLGDAIEFVDDHATGWPGTKTGCVTESWSSDLVLRANDQATWSSLPGSWTGWTRWVWDPVSSFQYITLPVDLGTTVAVLPIANIVADGVATFEIATSADGSSWSVWSSVAGPVVTRYIKCRVTVSIPVGSLTGPGVTPVCVLRRLTVSYIGKVSQETENDVNTSAFTGVHRIAAGDIRLPTQKSWAHISRVSVTLQSGSAGWNWTLIDKDGTNGPHIKIFNGSGVLSDCLIDWTIEGIAS